MGERSPIPVISYWSLVRDNRDASRIPETPQLGDVEMFPNSALATHSIHGKR
jgi:hypothetical protein